MPKLVIENTFWPTGEVTDLEKEYEVKNFTEATQKLKEDLARTASEDFTNRVLSQWHDESSVVHVLNGGNMGDKFRYKA